MKLDSAGQFSSRSFYRDIDPFSVVRSPSASAWMGLAPPRVEAFCWLAMAGKISMTDSLRRGLVSEAISDLGCFCGREMESIDHLFIRCDVATSIWSYFLKECGVSWCFPGSLTETFEAWRGIPMFGNSRILWRIILFPFFGQFGKSEVVGFLIQKN